MDVSFLTAEILAYVAACATIAIASLLVLFIPEIYTYLKYSLFYSDDFSYPYSDDYIHDEDDYWGNDDHPF